ncbi:MAG TPA: DUF4142 domain-containing protein [Pseudolabrys sp.]|nr:DUF4142 domain-containing protein [Pseudolabrys sp.]
MNKAICALALAAAMAFATGGALAQQPDKASQKFIKNAIEGNNAEVDVGKLAQQKGQSDAVKQYGSMLVTDHSAANDKAKQVAQELQVSPPTGTSVGQKATYAKLKLLSGANFDKSFAKSMVSDHQSDIKEYQKESQKSDAAGAYAKDSLPTLQKHLQEAQKLVQQVNQKQSSR